MTKTERQLRTKTAKIVGEVEQILREDFGLSQPLHISWEDQVRLLRLSQFREKYHVTLSWILHRLIPFWRSRHGRGKVKLAFGTRVHTLVGEVSEQYLASCVHATYPDGENELHWKTRARQAHWAAIWDGPMREDWSDPEAMAEKYRRRVVMERKARTGFQVQMQERQHRGNPWL